MKATMKLAVILVLIISSIQPVWAATIAEQSNQHSSYYRDGYTSQPQIFQPIEIPEGLPLVLLILVPICGGAILIGVLVIVLLMRRGKKNQRPSVPPSAPPPVMVTPPSPVSSYPAAPSPKMTARCPNCGANVSATAKFCNRCGTPLAAPQTSPPQQSPSYLSPQPVISAPNMQPAGQPVAPTGVPSAAPAPRSEPVIGIITSLAQQKGLSARQYNLIVTQQRLVFARLTNQMLKDAVSQAKQEAKGQGRGVFGQLGAMARANAKLCERYYNMPIDYIVQETPDNFVIYPQQIKRVRIQIANAFDETNNNIDRLVIHAGSRMTFQLKGTNARETKQILRQVLGNIVK